MDERPKGLFARLVRFLKVDPTDLTSPSMIRPKADGTLPQRIPAVQVGQSSRPSKDTKNK